MHALHVLSIEPSLFWRYRAGAPMGPPRPHRAPRIELFREHAHAIETLEAWLARKIRRGDIRAKSPPVFS